MQTNLPSSLAAIAAGRDHLQTAEFAKAVGKSHRTIQKNHSLSGECYGIRPIKIGGLLLWPVEDIAALLSGRRPAPPAKSEALSGSRRQAVQAA